MLPSGLLIGGILIWIVVHLTKSVTPGLRTSLINSIGEGPYKGLFSLTLIGAIVMMVMGWKATSPVLVYELPAGTRHVTMALMWLALILFVSARLPNDFKRILRHPQLTGVIIWAFAHLLSNGDSRSLWLFGGMFVWAHLEIIFINRRDGPRQNPEAVGLMRTFIPVAVGTVLLIVLAWFHPWLSGVSILPAN